MSDRDQIAAHLQYFTELGVTGVSKDKKWTARETAVAGSMVPGPMEPVPIEPGTEGPGPRDLGTTALLSIRQEIGDCTRCKLHTLGRKQIVFGVGNPNADLMFVGEAPGADEDEQGEPFVGLSGQLLTKIIEAIGMTRADVYIANVIKCRPPNNRAPESEEVATCEPFLFKQIDAIRPKVIVALGTHAAHALLKINTPISKLRGQVIEFRGGAKLIPTFHPAYLLRDQNPRSARRRDVWEDMKKVRALLAADE